MVEMVIHLPRILSRLEIRSGEAAPPTCALGEPCYGRRGIHELDGAVFAGQHSGYRLLRSEGVIGDNCRRARECVDQGRLAAVGYADQRDLCGALTFDVQ